MKRQMGKDGILGGSSEYPKISNSYKDEKRNAQTIIFKEAHTFAVTIRNRNSSGSCKNRMTTRIHLASEKAKAPVK